MKNTPENKLKFFAANLGQDYMTKYTQGKIDVSFLDSFKYRAGAVRVRLKSIKHLSEREFEREFGDVELGLNFDEDCPYTEYPRDDMVTLESIDSFRSKGYALPWMGLNISQLIEYGWVEIINN